jgi:membrane protease YdiL (CAAX protease family)
MLEDSSDKELVKKGWGIPGALFLGLSAYLLPQVLLIFFVPEINSLMLSENATNFVIMALFELLTIGAIIVFVRGYGLRLRDLGLANFKLSGLGLAALGFAIYIAASLVIGIVVQAIVPFDENQVQDIGFSNPNGPELVMVFVTIVILAPLAEELLFRGFIFKGVRRTLPFWPTAIIVSLLFGLVHGQINVGLDVFALSMVLCWLRERTGSLWPGIALHSGKNLVAFIVLYIIGVS